MKTVTIDIETMPHLGWVWDLWNQNIAPKQVKEFGRVTCFAAKTLGKPEITYHSDFHDGHRNMIGHAWDVLDQADCLVTYNGKAFDVRHLNREFLVAGLGPPSPYQHIDLYQVVKSKFKFASNKLDAVATALEIGGKVKHSGFDLWIDCMNGDIDAWAKMREYNKQDVVLTEELYQFVLPWISNHPNINVFSDEAVEGCTRCGSMDFQRRGFYTNTFAKYQQYSCNACGGWFKHKLSEKLTEYRSV
jgi:DNA polymerase elongation subunit (family B)